MEIAVIGWCHALVLGATNPEHGRWSFHYAMDMSRAVALTVIASIGMEQSCWATLP